MIVYKKSGSRVDSERGKCNSHMPRDDIYTQNPITEVFKSFTVCRLVCQTIVLRWMTNGVANHHTSIKG